MLSTTEAESLRRLCWKSCKTCKRQNKTRGDDWRGILSHDHATKLQKLTREETPEEDEVELIVELRLCPRAAAGSDEFGSLEIIDSAEEEPGAAAIAAAAAAEEVDETGAGG